MHLICPYCRAKLNARTLIEQSRGFCSMCNAEFNYAGTVNNRATTGPALLPAPPGYAMADEGTDLVITKPWFKQQNYLGFLFVGLWFALTYWFFHGQDQLPGPQYGYYVFLAFGVIALYSVIGSLCNRTVMCMNSTRLSVCHVPLPWPGCCTVPVGQIEQVYCRRNEEPRLNHKNETSYWSL